MPTTNDEKYGGKMGSSATEHFHLAEKQNALTFGGKGSLVFDKDDLALKDSEGKLIEVNSIDLEEFDVKLVSKGIRAHGQVYKFGPVGIKFQKPGLLTLPYICDWGLPFEGTIQVYSYSEVLDSWQATKKISQDFQNKTVTVEINHFSSYIPGTGSYQVDESGTLAGLPSIENVDPYFGSLALERKDVAVHARGVRLSISSKFNTDIVYDDLYSPTVTANGGTATANTIKHYIFAKGWNWQLPFITIGANVCKVQSPSRIDYNLYDAMSSWGGSGTCGAGSYEYSGSGSTRSLLVRLHHEKMIVTCSVTLVIEETYHPGEGPDPEPYYTYEYIYTPSNVKLYYADGSYAEFNGTGQISALRDPQNKNSLTYTWASTADPSPVISMISHTDGRAIKFYYFDEDSKKRMVTLLSSDNTTTSKIRAGDQFIGKYTLSTTSVSGKLEKYEALQTASLSDSDSFNLSSTNLSTYFSPLQSVNYTYSLAGALPGDYIQITNHSGGFTKYYFDKKCFGETDASYYNDSGEHGYWVYVYYTMNKPKVVRIEKKESSSVGSWKQVAYEYYTYWNGSWKNYFTSGNGGTGDYTDYLLNYTVAATSEKTSSSDSNRNRTFYYFAHTGGNYQGVSQTRNEKHGSSTWEFSSKTFNDFSSVTGTPPSKTFFFATDNEKSSGLEKYSDNWEYDSWARVTKTWRKLGSNGIDPTTWYQYVGAPTGYLDPFSKFSTGYFNNPYSGTYSDRFTSYKCMQLIGAVRRQNNSTADNDSIIFNDYDSNLNLIHTQAVEKSSLGTTEIFNQNPGFDLNGYRSPTTTYTYDGTTNNLVSITRAEGNSFTIHWGSGWKSSYVTRDEQALEENLGSPPSTQIIVNTFDYDIAGRLLQKESYLADSGGEDEYDGSRFPRLRVRYTYDGMGRLLTKSSVVDSTETILMKLIYDETNRMVSATDSLGFRTKTTYDRLYRVWKVEKWKPNVSGAGVDWVDGSGGVTGYLIGYSETEYDPVFSNPTNQRLYTAAASRSEADSDTYALTHTHYDNLGRVIDLYHSNFVDGSGTERHISNTTYVDAENAVIQKSYEDGSNYIQTRQNYDWLGRGIAASSTWSQKNAVGDPLVTSSTYDYAGRLTQTRLPNGNNNEGETYHYQYSSVGGLEKTIYPDDSESINNYDKNGNLTASVNRRGILTIYEYNDRDLVTTRIMRGAPDLKYHQTYCHFGAASSLQQRGDETVSENALSYSHLGAVTEFAQTVDGLRLAVQHTYDTAGIPTSRTVVGSGSGANAWSKTLYVNPQYHPSPDTNNFNLTALSPNADGSNPLFINASRFDGNAASIAYGSGKTVSFSYDSFQRLSAIDNSHSGIDDFVFTRDFLGNITSKTVGSSTNNLSYDGMNRLSSESSGSKTYSYDKLSNLLTVGTKSWSYELVDGDAKPVTYKNQMRLSRFQDSSDSSDWQVTHDLEGNIAGMTDRFKRLTYDGNNRLSRIEFYPNESGEIRVDRYRYDPSGLRIKKEEYTGLSGTTQKAVYYLYDGDQVLASETYEGSSIKETVVHVINGSGILASYTKSYSPSSEVLKYYYVDNLSSRTTITNAAGTTIEDACAYDSWGNLLSGDRSKARFTNKELDASGLIYFNARYYDPTIGRFITEDPARKGTGWYTYCSNNPVNRTDPTGKLPVDYVAEEERFIQNMENSFTQEYVGWKEVTAEKPSNDCDTWLESNAESTDIDLIGNWGKAFTTNADQHRIKAGLGQENPTGRLNFVIMQDERTERSGNYPNKIDSHVAAVAFNADESITLYEMGGHEPIYSHKKEYSSQAEFESSYPYYNEYTYYPANVFYGK